MQNVVSVILGGGKGTRLLPLTEFRSKPAVPIGGKYRLIDVPIANCINSGINRAYVLTQFNSASLNRHIRQTYRFDLFHGGFVEILAAQQTYDDTDWYQGTADAVRKQLRYLKQPGIDHVLILSGDQLYTMDYRDMLETHVKSNADVTIAALPVDTEKARQFGIMRLDDDGRVLGFVEKPQTDEDLELVRTPSDWIDTHGLTSNGREYLASMGIYLFDRDTLVELLEGSDYEDFGKEVFPMSIRARHVQSHLFDGYWEDIGTIKSFYESQLELARPDAPFELLNSESPIYTRPRFLPPTRIDGATIVGSLIADGCTISSGANIENSSIGLRCCIDPNVTIKNSVLMGADYYERKDARTSPIAFGVGEGTHIEGAIVDKDCRIGRNVRIAPREGMTDGTSGDVTIQDGVIVVRRNAEIPDGWVL
ncbi:MAG: glucose-1-phosphate adenylyltransferase [Planctomycetaceae bacterium]